MFKKILIANRGEIAIRIMATCREMGIHSVAVYSEADRYARHVREADEAYLLGPAPAAQSYLRIATLLSIARQSGAEAIHPGYGFLAENADLVDACTEAKIVFIGPTTAAMRLMGDKITAKELARSAGAPIVPGYNGESQDDTVLQNEAQHIGFPLLIKASAGGGGKGMRVVSAMDDFQPQLAGARREALAAFGAETVFLERLLQQPRHVEIQILGDQYGNIIYLGERECSIQRRQQKIIEESPSPAVSPALRAEMGETAVRIASAAGYSNAGTIEFLLDADMNFYFLEMNTRLQVEHPVTEQVIGLDMVRHQLHIACGEELGLTQQQITQRGHAIEVRIYAEDPQQQFLPSTGTITHIVTPTGPGIRVDSGVASGDEITQYYDPMIAKLIVTAEDRASAIARLHNALEQCAIFGVTTNVALLHTISKHPAFQAGATHTNFLTEHELTTTNTDVTLPEDVLIAAALSSTHAAILTNNSNQQPYKTAAWNPWQFLGPWRTMGEAYILTYRVQTREYRLALRPANNIADSWQIQIDDRPALEVTCLFGHDTQVLLKYGNQQVHAYVQRQGSETQVVFNGQLYRLQQRQPPDVNSAAHGGSTASTQKTLTAPMAGTIVKVQVRDGEHVMPHQTLIILSAMKMEHAISAPYEGIVRHVHYVEGSVVQGGVVVVEME